MYLLRPAMPDDLDFLVYADWQTGVEEDGAFPAWSAADYAAQRAKIATFITDPDKGALVIVPEAAELAVGMLLYRLRNRWHESAAQLSAGSPFLELDARLFPPAGDFCEVFQLWVAPLVRRQGLARLLKHYLEVEMRAQGVELIYTHTLARYSHVIALNRQLGYCEVRRGQLWDEAERVSLVKRLARD